ncbi:MAG: DUF2628 domain-containing protein [Treponema sp.]|nr:DUF2628 domain-containing protein [Treponema sp.]
MICKKCGRVLLSTDIYCPDCNEPNTEWTSESNVDQAEFIPSAEDLNLAAYVSGNALSKDFESGAFLSMKDSMLDFNKGKVSSWNWWAFFLSPFYLVYRKNYVLTIIALVLATVLAILDKSKALNLICPILQGVFCNYFMCQRYADKLKKAQEKYPDNLEMQREYLAIKGGKNIVLTVILVVLSVFCTIIALSRV